MRDADGITYFGEHGVDGWHEQIEIACNRCHECLARRKRDWAIRCVHEAEETSRLYQLEKGTHAPVANSCFVTLTYRDEELPEDQSVSSVEWRNFVRRLRRRTGDKNIRYLACGEYGSKGRAHYHGLLFGVSFHDDRETKFRSGAIAFSSERLTEIWGKGRTELGPCNYATAAYTAGYVLKKAYDQKLTRQPAGEEAHTYVQDESGAWREARPEFNVMSTNPGIGRRWIERNLEEVYSRDSVFINGMECRPPAFYDKVLEEYRPDHWAEIKRKRAEKMFARGLTSGQQRRARRSLFVSNPTQRRQNLE